VSYYNLNSVSRTLAHRIWSGIKDDPHLRTIIVNEGQIVHNPPRENQTGTAQLSIYLYHVSEIAQMRNQPPQNSPKPRTLLNLKLRYLITPLTFNAENDMVLLGKVMQLLAETPVLRGDELQGSLRDGGEDLRIVLDDVAAEDLGNLWVSLASPHKLSLSYTVYPVQIEASTPQRTLDLSKQPKQPAKNRP
jgi:hypothetical protein